MAYPKTHSRFGTAVDECPPHSRLKSGADPCLEIALPWARRDFRPTFAERQTPNA